MDYFTLFFFKSFLLCFEELILNGLTRYQCLMVMPHAVPPF